MSNVKSIEFWKYSLKSSGVAIIPIEDAFEFADKNRSFEPNRVHWVDGGESWAKGWRFTSHHANAEGSLGKLQRVGAGAGGEVTVLKRTSEEAAQQRIGEYR